MPCCIMFSSGHSNDGFTSFPYSQVQAKKSIHCEYLEPGTCAASQPARRRQRAALPLGLCHFGSSLPPPRAGRSGSSFCAQYGFDSSGGTGAPQGFEGPGDFCGHARERVRCFGTSRRIASAMALSHRGVNGRLGLLGGMVRGSATANSALLLARSGAEWLHPASQHCITALASPHAIPGPPRLVSVDFSGRIPQSGSSALPAGRRLGCFASAGSRGSGGFERNGRHPAARVPSRPPGLRGGAFRSADPPAGDGLSSFHQTNRAADPFPWRAVARHAEADLSIFWERWRSSSHRQCVGGIHPSPRAAVADRSARPGRHPGAHRPFLSAYGNP